MADYNFLYSAITHIKHIVMADYNFLYSAITRKKTLLWLTINEPLEYKPYI